MYLLGALSAAVVDHIIPGEKDLGDGDNFVAVGDQALDDAGQRFRGILGGVVEQDNTCLLYTSRCV